MKTLPDKSLSTGLVEPLEIRIAPASVFFYTDVDGDLVKITASKGSLTADKFTFADEGAGQQLQVLDLTDPSFANAKITFAVKKAINGDGQVNVGFINAAGIDLNSVKIRGDLGRIVVGDGNAAVPSIKLLQVGSMGVYGTSTQDGSAPAPLDPDILEALTDLLGGDGTEGLLQDVQNLVDGLVGTELTPELERLVGSLQSTLDSLLEALPGQQGAIVTNLLQNLNTDVEALLGVSPNEADVLGATLNGLLEDVDNILDPLIGGTIGDDLGGILDPGGLLGSGSVVGDLLGGLLGTGGGSGGGAGAALDGVLGPVLDGLDDLLTLDPGQLDQLPLDLRTLLGDVRDTLDDILNGTGTLTADTIRDLAGLQSTIASQLGLDGIVPATLPDSVANLLEDVAGTITGILGGNGGGSSGGGDATARDIITSTFNGNVGTIKVTRDVNDVFLNVIGNIRAVSVGGSVAGTTEVNGGEIFASGNIGTVLIGKNLVGGDTTNSGSIHANGTVKSVTIRGSILGGEGGSSGSLNFGSDVGSVRVRGDLSAEGGMFSGSIVNENGRIGRLTISGAVIGGEQDDASQIYVSDSIGTLTIGRGILGDADHRVSIVAGAEEVLPNGKNTAFGNVVVRGSANYAQFLGGFNMDLSAINGSAQIGKVVVNGDWHASSISAGVGDGDGDFAEAGETRATTAAVASSASKIASIQVRGAVLGSDGDGDDHFGFTANEIGLVKIGKSKLALQKGTGNDVIELAQATDDVTVREVSMPT